MFSHSQAFSLTPPLLFSLPVEEENPAFWNQKAAEALDVAKKLQPIQTSAKNLIILMGDGECVCKGGLALLGLSYTRHPWREAPVGLGDQS